MKKDELIKRFQEIDEKFEQLGDFQVKISEIEAAKQNVEAIKLSIENVPSEVNTIKDVATNNAAIIESAKSEISDLKTQVVENNEQLKKLTKRASELEKETENQLGYVNAESLANSFGERATEHGKSSRSYFWWVFGSTLMLVLVSISVVLWELSTSSNFLSSNFLIKAVLTTPIIFFLIFTVKLHGHENRLYDEYAFKSAVARSFEAYRKLMSKECSQEPNLNIKAVDFYIQSINGIYSSPCQKSVEESEELGKSEINLFRKIIGMLKSFLK